MNPLTLVKWAPWAIAGVLAVLLTLMTNLYTGKRDELTTFRAEVQTAGRIAEAEARKTETAWKLKLEEAKNAATERERLRRADADRLNAVNAGLRNDLDTLGRRLSDATAEAAAHAARACYSVLGTMAAEGGRMAEAADGHYSDSVMLLEAWPR